MMRVIDGRPHLRPCAVIKSEGTENTEWAPEPIARQYELLTTMLPLAGGAVMPPAKPGGEPRLAATLREEAPWMGAAIDRVAGQIAMQLWAGRPWVRFRPLLLVGPPGGGKSHLARRLGEFAGTGSALLSFAGVHSSAELAGNPRGYKHVQPSVPALAMQRARTANPVCVIDEVEKAAADGQGDPVATLLTMLEPSTARRYYDGALAAEVDLSQVNWLLTANSVARLPAPLLSQVDLVEHGRRGPIGCDGETISGLKLWQATDDAATRDQPSAPVAHHLIGFFPPELDMSVWREIVFTFVQKQLVSQGMIVDWAIHALGDGQGGWLKKPHVHLLATHRFWKASERQGEPHDLWLATAGSRKRLTQAWADLTHTARVQGLTGR